MNLNTDSNTTDAELYAKTGTAVDIIALDKMEETRTFANTVNSNIGIKKCDTIQTHESSQWSLHSGLYRPGYNEIRSFSNVQGIPFAPVLTDSSHYRRCIVSKHMSSFKRERRQCEGHLKLKHLGVRKVSLKGCEKRITHITLNTSILEELFPLAAVGPRSVNVNLSPVHQNVLKKYMTGDRVGETKHAKNYAHIYEPEMRQPDYKCQASLSGGSCVLNRLFSKCVSYSDGMKRIASGSRISTGTVVKESREDLETLHGAYAKWDHDLKKRGDLGLFETYHQVVRDESLSTGTPKDVGPENSVAILPAWSVRGKKTLVENTNPPNQEDEKTLFDITNHKRPYSVFEDVSERGFINSFRAALNVDTRSDESHALLELTGSKKETSNNIEMQEDENPVFIRSREGNHHYSYGCPEHLKMWPIDNHNTTVSEDSFQNSSQQDSVEKNNGRIPNEPLPGFCNMCQLTCNNLEGHTALHGEHFQNDGKRVDSVVAVRNSSVEGYFEKMMISKEDL